MGVLYSCVLCVCVCVCVCEKECECVSVCVKYSKIFVLIRYADGEKNIFSVQNIPYLIN